ncbi:MAG: Basic Secretory Protein [Bradyrhizobium sp.]|nr:Basic Secretory Protein [Bradyrhizobium sp.]
MRRHSSIALVIAFTVACGFGAPTQAAQDRVITHGTFTVDFRDLTGTADQRVADRLIEAFFMAYPQMVADFNPAAPRRVQIAIDPSWTAVAVAENDQIRVDPDWLRHHPDDIDLITHELMHVVQAYRHSNGPGWLVEGIADYARAVYGVDNKGAHWALMPVGPQSRYSDGYRVTAQFLLWLEAHGHIGVVEALDAAIRDNKYKKHTWKKLTGRPIDEEWPEFVASTALVVHTSTTPITPERMIEIKRLVAQILADQAKTGGDAGPGGPVAPTPPAPPPVTAAPTEAPGA